MDSFDQKIKVISSATLKKGAVFFIAAVILFLLSIFISFYSWDLSGVCSFLAFVCLIIAVVLLIVGIVRKKELKKFMNLLGTEESFQKLRVDYEIKPASEYKKLKLILTENYIFSYAPKALTLISCDHIINAYRSNIINGQFEHERYIKVETDYGKAYYIAKESLKSRNPQFAEALQKIKSREKLEG